MRSYLWVENFIGLAFMRVSNYESVQVSTCLIAGYSPEYLTHPAIGSMKSVFCQTRFSAGKFFLRFWMYGAQPMDDRWFRICSYLVIFTSAIWPTCVE